MAYQTPKTWAAGNKPTAAEFNQDLRDNVSFLANPPACRVYRSTNQSFTTGVAADVTFDTERYDTAAMHSTSVNTNRITMPVAGLYIVTGHITFAAHATGNRYLAIKLNGTTYLAVDLRAPATATNACDMSIATVYKFAANDYVTLEGFQASGGNLNASATPNYTPEFSATWIGLG